MELEKIIRIIPHRMDDASLSLAIDQALFQNSMSDLKSGKEPAAILRTYQFSKPTVVFGHNQSIDGRYSTNHFKGELHITKRDTGGGHIFYSPQDIMFSFIATDNFYGDMTLEEKYRFVNEFVTEALRNCGYQAETGRTSIRINGKIVAGTARQRGGMNNSVSLHHGGILYTRYDDTILSTLMARPDEIERIRRLVTSLQEHRGDYFKIPEEIITAFKKEYKTIAHPLTQQEMTAAEKSRKETYNNHDHIKAGDKIEDICLVALEYTKDNDKK